MDWPIIASTIFWWLIVGYLFIKIHWGKVLTKREIDETAEVLAKITYTKCSRILLDMEKRGLSKAQKEEVVELMRCLH